MIFPSLEKSTKLSVSWYGVPVPSSKYLGKKLPIGDATIRRKKDDATVNQRRQNDFRPRKFDLVRIYYSTVMLKSYFVSFNPIRNPVFKI